MHRCSGGQNQHGYHKPGRLHLHDGEQDCSKHDSDNFSLLSTQSRAAARNRPRGTPTLRSVAEDPLRSTTTHALSEIDGSDGSTATGSGSVSRSPLPEWISESVSPGSSRAATASETPVSGRDDGGFVPRPILGGAFVKLGARPAVTERGERRKEGTARAEVWTRSDVLFVGFWVVLVLYFLYRWIYRESFRYQDAVVRRSYGLPMKKGGYFI